MCHGVYSLNLKTFPFIQLSSVPFISSCVLVFADHFLWFKYFTKYYRPFMDIASFFGVCVWLVPFTYFISLSANDNALPLSDPNAADTIPNQQKKGLFKTLFGFLGIKQQDQTAFPTANSNPTSSSSGINTTYTTNTSNVMLSSSSRSHYPSGQLQNRKAV
ncbi:transmembrane adaptor Erv26-domain-containing protein [Absidia repens]|uniref:Transmembrane adaptor Erv26-domain-containing protein n=1 Tax=Absidia repens TaxID=90262 RepID=A0A1X2ISS6_9FUNG|nr:transmembrane adaptor Erv26-domain-containing protein [Absidia repens]